MTSPNEPQAELWESLAPGWLAAEAHSELVASPFGLVAIDRLDPRAGHHVLDIGCGSGGTTLELARRVAPDGRALGVDIAPAMVGAADARAREAGTTNVRFAVADAQVDRFDDGPFDLAFSRFGVMFFADAIAAFSNIRAALKPGGALGFVCWQPLFVNEWMLVPAAAAMSVTGSVPEMPEPDEPGPFSLSDPARVESVLGGAGFTEIEVEPQSQEIVLSEAHIGRLIDLSRRVGPVRVALADADEETAARILQAVHDALFDRIADGELRLGAGAFVVHARA